MKLSTKGRYALLALVDIAHHQKDGLVATNEISRRQDISLFYLEQLVAKLRRNNILISIRGPGGGYKLARDPETIRISEILSAVDESVNALAKGAGAKGGECGTREQSLSNRLWEGLSAHVFVFLHQATLSDVITNALVPCPAIPEIFDPEETCDNLAC